MSLWHCCQRTDAYLITLSNGYDFSSHSYPLGELSLWFSWALWLHFLTLWFQRSRAGREFPDWSIHLCYGQEITARRSSKSLDWGMGSKRHADSPSPNREPGDQMFRLNYQTVDFCPTPPNVLSFLIGMETNFILEF